MKLNRLHILFLLFIIAIGYAGYKLYLQKQSENIFTGTVEVTKADLTSKVSGYLLTMDIEEGDYAEKNSVISKIDPRDYLVQLEHDEAAYLAAKAVLKDLQKGAREQKIMQAAAQTDAAYSAYYKANEDWQRYQSLYTTGAVARQVYDEALNNMTVAKKQYDIAKAAYDLLRSGTREDRIEAQLQEVKRSEAVLQQSRNNLDYTDLKSPVNGVVLTKNYECGEYIMAGNAVLTLADLTDCWVKIYVPSEILGQIAYGQEAEVKIDAYPDRTFTGKVARISDRAEFTPRQSITTRERANMVFEVEVRLLNEEKIFKPGMIADVIFNG